MGEHVTWAVVRGDMREVLARMPALSFDSLVTDPPYELSDCGKASAARVAAEVLFPQQPKLKSGGASECNLLLLACEVARLCGVGLIPRPASAMPIVSVALDHESPTRKHEIENGGVSAFGVSGDASGDYEHPKSAEYLGRFFLEAADTESSINALSRAGCCLSPSGFWIGTRVQASSFPSLDGSRLIVNNGDPVVRLLDDSLASSIGAAGRTKNLPVPHVCTSGGSVQYLAASAAASLLSTLKAAGAKVVRARPGASGLAPVPEPHDVRLIAFSARGAVAFDLVIHPKNLRSLGFMGKAWDGSKIAFDPATWRACARVMKPGAYGVAFGGTRTFHRIACAIEDAGFEIRDTLSWLYGSGFPKSLNGAWGGTALKPAWEPIVLFRKPLHGTVAANHATFGTGGLQIDATRIGTENTRRDTGTTAMWASAGRVTGGSEAGRWPANVCLDEEAARALDAHTGNRGGGYGTRGAGGAHGILSPIGGTGETVGYGDTGGTSRFFYVAKTNTREREAGCEHLPKLSAGELTGDRAEGSDGLNSPRAGAGRSSGGRANHHPTVKPISLMQWLVRLVTPPGGRTFDPFCGSGTTVVAAIKEGRHVLGIDLDTDEHGNPAGYTEIARARARHHESIG